MFHKEQGSPKIINGTRFIAFVSPCICLQAFVSVNGVYLIKPRLWATIPPIVRQKNYALIEPDHIIQRGESMLFNIPPSPSFIAIRSRHADVRTI